MEGKTGKTGLLEISAHWFLDFFFVVGGCISYSMNITIHRDYCTILECSDTEDAGSFFFFFI